MDDPEPQVMLEAVVVTMSSPMLRGAPVEPVEPGVASARRQLPPILSSMAVARRVELEFELAAVVALAVAALVVAADVRVAILVGSFVIAAVGVRWVDGRVSFSFGEGFVGYRADLGWPRGVQEDDDVRWNWKGSAAGAGSSITAQRIFVNPMDKASRGR